MSVIPIISAKEIVSVLLKAGFKIIRQEGSHIRFYHPVKKKSTTVALHIGDLTRKVLKKILSQADISVDEFLKLIGKK